MISETNDLVIDLTSHLCAVFHKIQRIQVIHQIRKKS